MKPTVWIDNEEFETDWDDPLLVEQAWLAEKSKVVCHFFYIEKWIETEEDFFNYLLS